MGIYSSQSSLRTSRTTTPPPPPGELAIQELEQRVSHGDLRNLSDGKQEKRQPTSPVPPVLAPQTTNSPQTSGATSLAFYQTTPGVRLFGGVIQMSVGAAPHVTPHSLHNLLHKTGPLVCDHLFWEPKLRKKLAPRPYIPVDAPNPQHFTSPASGGMFN